MMNKIILGFAIVISCLTFGQKVKFKSGKVVVDKVEVFQIQRVGDMETLSTLDGKEICTVIYNVYQVRNPFPRTSYNSSSWTPYVDESVQTIKFIDLKKDITTKLNLKDIINAIISSKIVNAEGSLNAEAVDRFEAKYNDENAKLLIN